MSFARMRKTSRFIWQEEDISYWLSHVDGFHTGVWFPKGYGNVEPVNCFWKPYLRHRGRNSGHSPRFSRNWCSCTNSSSGELSGNSLIFKALNPLIAWHLGTLFPSFTSTIIRFCHIRSWSTRWRGLRFTLGWCPNAVHQVRDSIYGNFQGWSH